MKELYAHNNKGDRKSTRYIALVLVVVLLIHGLVNMGIYALLCSVLLFFATLLKKRTVITGEGIEIRYDFRVFQFKEKWSFLEISEIYREIAPDTNYKIMHATKGAMTRRLVLLTEDAEEFIARAKQANPKLHFGETK